MAGLLDTSAAAKYLHVKPTTLEQMRWRGDGPPFVRLSRRAVRYRPEDLDEYIRERLVRSTSEVADAA